jgi:cell division protein FtsB
MAKTNRVNRGGVRIFGWIAPILVTAFVLMCGAGSYADTEALLRASGNLPAAKTENTIKAEKELEKLTAKEKQLKDQINDATINRSKLLTQKRADLKQIRQKRDDVIKREITAIKDKKERQAKLIRDLKKQLAIMRKIKNKFAASALETTILLADIKLQDINDDLKVANDKLSQSYKDYKEIYDELTRLDYELKKILDLNDDTEKKIKDQKADFQNEKALYNQSVKSKDFLTAERKMDTLVFIQTGVVNNYANILDIKLKFKSDYYQMVVNYKL